MKIKKLAIIILMTTIFIILDTKVFAKTGEINSKDVKLRKKPDSSSTILDIIYEGDEVEILEQEDGWYKIKAKTSLGKVTGYVSKKEVNVKEENIPNNVEEKKEVEENTNTETPKGETEIYETVSTGEKTETTQDVVISTNIEENNQYTLTQEVSIKPLPLINSREKAKLTGNITVIETINNWARIENDIESGWIRKNTLKGAITTIETTAQYQETQELPTDDQKQKEQPVEAQTTETAQEEKVPEATKNEEAKEQTQPKETEINKTGYVSADGLRVRKGPSTDTEEINSLSKNDKVEIIGQTGNWYKIKLNGKIGYVSVKYISDTKVPETTSRSGSTLKNETITQPEEVKKEETTQSKEKQEQETSSPETAEPEQTTSGISGAAIVEYAKQYLGYKYVAGGASPSKGFDCSGFTTYVYKHFGISLNRSSKDQIKNGVAVQKSDLQPGDLVVFNNDANTKIGHVGIYIGNGNFIHASNPSDGVKITTLLSGYYAQRYVGARRVI